MAAETGTGHHAVDDLVENLGYQQVRAHRDSHLLTKEHKLQRQKMFPRNCCKGTPWKVKTFFTAS
jgi:hypothetical protein